MEYLGFYILILLFVLNILFRGTTILEKKPFYENYKNLLFNRDFLKNDMKRKKENLKLGNKFTYNFKLFILKNYRIFTFVLSKRNLQIIMGIWFLYIFLIPFFISKVYYTPEIEEYPDGFYIMYEQVEVLGDKRYRYSEKSSEKLTKKELTDFRNEELKQKRIINSFRIFPELVIEPTNNFIILFYLLFCSLCPLFLMYKLSKSQLLMTNKELINLILNNERETRKDGKRFYNSYDYDESGYIHDYIDKIFEKETLSILLFRFCVSFKKWKPYELSELDKIFKIPFTLEKEKKEEIRLYKDIEERNKN